MRPGVKITATRDPFEGEFDTGEKNRSKRFECLEIKG